MSPLRAIRIVHTLAWALFAGCIVALPFAAWRRRFDVATILIAVVLLEVCILLANRFRRQLRHLPAAVAGPLQQADLRQPVLGWNHLHAGDVG
jgi:hypothetical protein